MTRLMTVSILFLLLALEQGGSRAEPKSKHEPGKHDDHEEAGASGHAEHGDEDDERRDEGLIVIKPEQMTAMGIETAEAGPGELRKRVALPGEVKLNADAVAHIFPRFAGVVKQVRKTVGDKVKKGETLAMLESNESLSNYQITSLIDGTIIEKHVTLGEIVREDREVFVVADLSTVWIELNVYPKDLPYVRKDNAVRISSDPHLPDTEGVVAYVSPVVSKHTRTALARVVLPNPNDSWRPGLFVTAKVTTEATAVPLLIVKDALQTINGTTSVFVAIDGGFKARAVKIGRTDEQSVEVTAGLNPGDRYVSKGSFIMKAELGKSEAGHDHG